MSEILTGTAMVILLMVYCLFVSLILFTQGITLGQKAVILVISTTGVMMILWVLVQLTL